MKKKFHRGGRINFLAPWESARGLAQQSKTLARLWNIGLRGAPWLRQSSGAFPRSKATLLFVVKL
jgi:hypothetical protein